jgi:hypothetical protein
MDVGIFQWSEKELFVLPPLPSPSLYFLLHTFLVINLMDDFVLFESWQVHYLLSINLQLFPSSPASPASPTSPASPSSPLISLLSLFTGSSASPNTYRLQ